MVRLWAIVACAINDTLGLCLETQLAPGTPNRNPSSGSAPSARLDPGQAYSANVHYRFGIHG